MKITAIVLAIFFTAEVIHMVIFARHWRRNAVDYLGELFGRSPGSVRESERVAEECRVDYVPKFILLAFLFWYLAAWLP